MARTKKSNQMPAFVTIDGVEFELVDINISATGHVSETRFTVDWIHKLATEGAITTEILTQRTEGQWSKRQSSNLIVSIIYGRDIGTILLTGKGCTSNEMYEKNAILDGAQRFSALCNFLDDNLALTKDIKPISCCFKDKDGNIITRNIDIAGLKFSQLPVLIQNRIINYGVKINIYNGFSDDELDDIVFCCNNGTAFKPMQKVRTILGSKTMKYIQPICNSTLWDEAKNCKKENDSILGCVLRSLILYTGHAYKNLSMATISAFAELFTEKSEKTIRLQTEGLLNLVDTMAQIVPKLSDDELSILNACNIPHLLMNLDRFWEYYSDIDITEYLNFLHAFIGSKTHDEYNAYCTKTGSGGTMYSYANANKRQNIIDNALDNYMIENEFVGGKGNGEEIRESNISEADSAEDTKEECEEDLFTEEDCDETEQFNSDDESDCFETDITETRSCESNINEYDTGEHDGISIDKYQKGFESNRPHGILSEDTRIG